MRLHRVIWSGTTILINGIALLSKNFARNLVPGDVLILAAYRALPVHLTSGKETAR